VLLLAELLNRARRGEDELDRNERMCASNLRPVAPALYSVELRSVRTAGEGVEPSISSFKERRAAGCTIPQNLIGAAGLEPAISRPSGANIGYKPTALPLSYAPFVATAAFGVEPKSPDSESSILPVERHRKKFW
jgi:hypothetical protein